MIAVTERDGTLELVRVAVGDHILLGGDNMDLALAHTVRAKLAQQGISTDPWQLQGLTHACRGAKETLLMEVLVAAVPVVVPSRGSRLIGGTLRTELTRGDEPRWWMAFPVVDAAARPSQPGASGPDQLGLPYAQDAAMTRHLAAFLGRQLHAADRQFRWVGCGPRQFSASDCGRCCSALAMFKAPPLLARTLEVLNSWLLAAEGAPPVRLLERARIWIWRWRGGDC